MAAPIQTILSKLQGVRQTSSGWQANCPSHNDVSPSLSIGEGSNGKVLLKCHTGCKYQSIMAALGLGKSPLFTVHRGGKVGALGEAVEIYNYDGFFEVVRFEPKDFRQRRPDGAGGYTWNMKGVETRVYRQNALQGKNHVIIVEGERDVHTLEALGFDATTNPGGAKKWKEAHTKALAAAGVKRVTVMADTDQTGKDHAVQVAESCRKASLEVSAVEDLPAKDISDYLAKLGVNIGVRAKAVNELIERAAPWKPPTKTKLFSVELTNRIFSRKNAKALEAVLNELDLEIRYNLRSAEAEYRKGGGPWTAFDERFTADLREYIGNNYSYTTEAGKMSPLKYGHVGWEDATNALLHHREVDPFKDWLESLPEWDGTPVIDVYLNEIFETDKDNPLVVWAGRFLFLGAIQRTYEPGSKLDETPVFVGRQGIGKSAMLRSIFPPERADEWFADGLNLAAEPKVRAESILGRVLVECAEMTGATRAELASLKAFLTRTDDGSVRLAYRRNPERTPRRAIFAGTTDKSNSLPNDPAGNRRYVVVELTASRGPVEPWMDSNREQLWAEALVRYHEGKRANIPRELASTAAEIAEKHRNKDDVLEDKIREIQLTDNFGTLRELAELCELVPRGSSPESAPLKQIRRLTDALTNCGWQSVRTYIRGERVRGWEKNENLTTTSSTGQPGTPNIYEYRKT